MKVKSRRVSDYRYLWWCPNCDILNVICNKITTKFVIRRCFLCSSEHDIIIAQSEIKKEKTMVIWVQKEVVFAECDQRAIIKEIDGNNIKIQLLGTNEEWDIQSQHIIGVELNESLVIKVNIKEMQASKATGSRMSDKYILPTAVKKFVIDRLLEEGFEIHIGPHDGCEGYFAEVTKGQLKDLWFSCGHGHTWEEALGNGKMIAKGFGPITIYTPECFKKEEKEL